MAGPRQYGLSVFATNAGADHLSKPLDVEKAYSDVLWAVGLPVLTKTRSLTTAGELSPDSSVTYIGGAAEE